MGKYRTKILGYLQETLKSTERTRCLLLQAYGHYYVRRDFIRTMHTIGMLENCLHWYQLEDRLLAYRFRREVESDLEYQWNQ